MKKKRRAKRTYKPEFKAAVVKRVLRGRASRTETQRSIAGDLGISENRLSDWVRSAQVKKELLALEKSAPDAEVSGPTLELRGLRAWVNHAVRLEVDRILAAKGIK